MLVVENSHETYIYIYIHHVNKIGTRNGVVDEALRRKPGGRGFDTR
jgi:hypothetical protein